MRVTTSLLIPSLALLSGCQAKISAELTDGPTDDAAEVVLDLTHIALQTDSGGIVQFELDEPGPVDLLLFRKGETYRLVSDRDLDDDTYTGIALDFAADGSYVRRTDGTQVEINPPATRTFAPIDLLIDGADEKRLIVDLNLRFSLVDTGTGSYDLDPVVRAVRPGEVGAVTGAVATTIVESTDCQNGRPAGRGVAVYAFKGRDAVPNDYTGQAALIDAANVELDSGGTYRYELHFLPTGDYTLALTCQADDDHPATDDAVTFEATGNVSVTSGGTAVLDFL